MQNPLNRAMRRIRTGRASRVEKLCTIANWQCEAAVNEAMAERRQWAVYAAYAAYCGLPMFMGRVVQFAKG